MITCEKCAKKTGEGPVGESWICEDCKVEPPVREGDNRPAGEDLAAGEPL
ncbi:hypothetical protein [Paenibacillus validus]|uniref:Uncharacterized protein n=1 Tax=Paenibacillus validus TaxID=44253 RepID=A0A7X2Z6N3_9BACL|nr:hypothetical protein [Paenibacillus validus]MUG69330.1 hypothetical protein [Paenibacillus validus]